MEDDNIATPVEQPPELPKPAEVDGGSTSPVAKKARKSVDVCAPNDERVGRAARMMLSNPGYSVPQAMLNEGFK